MSSTSLPNALLAPSRADGIVCAHDLNQDKIDGQNELSLRFHPSGLSQLEEGSVNKTILRFSAEARAADCQQLHPPISVTVEGVEVRVHGRALPSLKRSKMVVEVDQKALVIGSRTVGILEGSTVNIQIDARDVDGFHISDKSIVRFVMNWNDGSSNAAISLDLRYSEQGRSFHGALKLPAGEKRLALWLEEVHTAPDFGGSALTYQPNPVFSSDCEIPVRGLGNSSTCTPLVIEVTQIEGKADFQTVLQGSVLGAAAAISLIIVLYLARRNPARAKT